MTGITCNRSVTLSKMAVAAVLIAALAAALLAGCGSGAGATSETTTTAAETTTAATTATTTQTTATTAATTATTAATTTAAPDPSAPRSLLTGEWLADGQSNETRPLAIMINNIKVATPQIGIGSADIIYEMPVEGGITRMMAVFADTASIPETGSVRSARHDYIELAGGLDAILVHAGASYLAYNVFDSQPISHIDLLIYSSAGWRDSEWLEKRGTEHSVKTNGERLEKALEKAKLRTKIRDSQTFAFNFREPGDFAPAGETQAENVSAPFSSYCVATFTYDLETRLYAKGEFGKPQIDLADREPIRFTNVFLLLADIGTMDSKLKEIDLRKGKGYYISGGTARKITWKKGESGNSFVFTGEDGEELPVNVGKSYVGILSDNQTITFKP